MTSPWVTPAEIAAELNISKMTVFRLLRDGKIRHTRVGRQFRIRRSDFDQYLENNTTGGEQ